MSAPCDTCSYTICSDSYRLSAINSGTCSGHVMKHVKNEESPLETQVGVKLDTGKVRPSLVLSDMPRALLAVSEVAAFGIDKKGYIEGSWLNVKDGIKRYTDALDRHRLNEAISVIDVESGLLHAKHLAWNALARLELMLRDMEGRE